MRLARIACIAALTLVPTLASATILTFDDLPGSGDQIPSGYGGFVWDNFYYIDPSTMRVPSGYPNGLVSGHRVAFNGYGNPAGIEGVESFDLISGYFTGAWKNDLLIDVTGFRNGMAVDHTSFRVMATAPTFQVFNWLNVDKVWFSASGGVPYYDASTSNNFALDDLRVENVQPVPEPGTLVLIGSGLVLGYRRRRATNTRSPQHTCCGQS